MSGYNKTLEDKQVVLTRSDNELEIPYVGQLAVALRRLVRDDTDVAATVSEAEKELLRWHLAKLAQEGD